MEQLHISIDIDVREIKTKHLHIPIDIEVSRINFG